jgi:hypothetical protein
MLANAQHQQRVKQTLATNDSSSGCSCGLTDHGERREQGKQALVRGAHWSLAGRLGSRGIDG